jgi:anti-sigma regulatory factor (Ser/Thr protein kinase)
MLLEISDTTHTAAARRATAMVAQNSGIGEDEAGRLALIVTEIATNMLKHGGGGQISVDVYRDGTGHGIELIALDKGTGIADLPQALTAGYSTSGTSGNGLNIIKRQSDLFTVFSRPNMGTVLVGRIAIEKAQTDGGAVLGAVAAPYPGETVCGDSWAYAATERGHTLFVVDGSGHGLSAQQAANTAVDVFQRNSAEPCERIIERVHRALQATRGAAVAVARVDRDARLVRFVGVGNIGGAVISGPNVHRTVSHNGTAGMLTPRIREFTYSFDAMPTVLMHSDGLTSKWDLSTFPGLLTAHPSIIAGVMFRDFRRGRDDATVVAMRAA